MGCILAGILKQSGNLVYGVQRKGEINSVLGNTGISITGVQDLTAKLDAVYQRVEGLTPLDLDYVFICTKAYTLPHLSFQLRDFDSKVKFVCAQNGIDNEFELAKVVEKERVFRLVMNFAGNVIDPGKVKFSFFHPPNYIGIIDRNSIAEAEDIALMLSESGLETRFTDNLAKEAWRKAILNILTMPFAIITGWTMDKITSFPFTREMVERVLYESLKVAKAAGFEYEDEFPEKAMSYVSNAGQHKPSMLVDYEKGAPLEIDFLNGKIQEYADNLKVDAPYNKLLISLVKALVNKRDTKNG